MFFVWLHLKDCNFFSWGKKYNYFENLLLSRTEKKNWLNHNIMGIYFLKIEKLKKIYYNYYLQVKFFLEKKIQLFFQNLSFLSLTLSLHFPSSFFHWGPSWGCLEKENEAKEKASDRTSVDENTLFLVAIIVSLKMNRAVKRNQYNSCKFTSSSWCSIFMFTYWLIDWMAFVQVLLMRLAFLS